MDWVSRHVSCHRRKRLKNSPIQRMKEVFDYQVVWRWVSWRVVSAMVVSKWRERRLQKSMRWLERQGWDVGAERVDGWSQKVRVSELGTEIDMEQVDESLRQKETEKVSVTCQRADSLQLKVFVKGRDAVCSTEDQTVAILRIHWDTSILRKSIFNSWWISSGLCANESSQFEICNTLGWFCSSQVLVVSGHPRVRHLVRPLSA